MLTVNIICLECDSEIRGCELNETRNMEQEIGACPECGSRSLYHKIEYSGEDKGGE